MRLVTVPEPPEFSAKCLKCGKSIPTGEKIADLDGEPFRAYYHFECLPPGHDIQVTVNP